MRSRGRNRRIFSRSKPNVRQNPASTRPLAVETLESRMMMAVDLEVLKHIETSLAVYTPSISPIVEAGGVAYFAAKASSNSQTTLWRSDGTEAGTHMVRDIRYMDGPKDVQFESVRTGTLNGVLYFQANGPDGVELWRSDGTAEGTYQFADLSSGITSSRAAPMGVAGDYMYFRTNLGAGGSLWRTDGTVAGTVKLRDFSGTFNAMESNASIGGVLYWRVDDGVHGSEVWRTDGTVDGTYLLKDVNVGATGSQGDTYFGATWMRSVGETLFFLANDGVHGAEVWKSDGTAAGTVLLKDIFVGSASSRPMGFAAFDGALIFSAGDATTGSELWKSDGTEAGTVLIKDIQPGPGNGAWIWSFAPTSNGVFFRGNDGVHGYEIWKTDGTEAGTLLVKDVNTGFSNGAYDDSFLAIGDILYFRGNDGAFGKELWRTDGTEVGTYLVEDSKPGPAHGDPTRIANVAGKLFFTANEKYGIWTSDGTAANTGMVKDLRTETLGSNPSDFTPVGDVTYFITRRLAHTKLWKTSGTAESTVEVADFPTSWPMNLVNVNGLLYFSMVDANKATRLWKTDGMPGGLVDLGVVGASQNAMQHGLYGVLGDTVFFTTYNDQTYGRELWASDGTPAGTGLLKDINPTGDSQPTGWRVLNGELYFSANDGANGSELWKTDGTEAGTVRVTNFSYADAAVDLLLELNGWLYFKANDGATGRELWKTDGTAAGTVQVIDLIPGPGSGADFGRAATVVNGLIYMSANDGTSGSELWRTDGTAAGTQFVKDIAPGAATSGIMNGMVNANGTLFFVANDGVHGRELWKSDGTSAGTYLVKDIWANNRYPQDLVSLGSKVYFLGDDPDATIWESDGTEAGTVAVDVRPGTSSNGGPGGLTTDGQYLYFSAAGPYDGAEPWIGRPQTPAPLEGDYNEDGIVGGDDFLAWQLGFGSPADPVGSGADGDGDGTIGAGDLEVWKEHYGDGAATVSNAATAVAEARESSAVNTLSASLASVELHPEALSLETESDESFALAARDRLFAAGDFTRLYAELNEDASFRERWRRRR